MKKFVLSLLIVMLFITVYARENRLYFTESNKRLYYESALIDEKVFMKHQDMVPGKSYTDNLVIENGTKTPYTLYFKVIPRDQSSNAHELLDHINMDIYLNDTLIYSGFAKGLDYRNRGINLQDAISLGEIAGGSKSNMRVETSLSTAYSNTDNDDLSYVDWQFYAQYEDSEPQIIDDVPKTDLDRSSVIYIISITAVVIGILLIVYIECREKNKKKRK